MKSALFLNPSFVKSIQNAVGLAAFKPLAKGSYSALSFYPIYYKNSKLLSQLLDFYILSTTQGHLRTIRLSHKQTNTLKPLMYKPFLKSVHKTIPCLHKHKIKHTYTNSKHTFSKSQSHQYYLSCNVRKARTCWYRRPFRLIYDTR